MFSGHVRGQLYRISIGRVKFEIGVDKKTMMIRFKRLYKKNLSRVFFWTPQYQFSAEHVHSYCYCNRKYLNCYNATQSW